MAQPTDRYPLCACVNAAREITQGGQISYTLHSFKTQIYSQHSIRTSLYFHKVFFFPNFYSLFKPSPSASPAICLSNSFTTDPLECDCRSAWMLHCLALLFRLGVHKIRLGTEKALNKYLLKDSSKVNIFPLSPLPACLYMDPTFLCIPSCWMVEVPLLTFMHSTI